MLCTWSVIVLLLSSKIDVTSVLLSGWPHRVQHRCFFATVVCLVGISEDNHAYVCHPVVLMLFYWTVVVTLNMNLRCFDASAVGSSESSARCYG